MQFLSQLLPLRLLHQFVVAIAALVALSNLRLATLSIAVVIVVANNYDSALVVCTVIIVVNYSRVLGCCCIGCWLADDTFTLAFLIWNFAL